VFAKRLTDRAIQVFPRYALLQEQDRSWVVGEIMGTLCCLPFALAGLVWLVAVSDLHLLLAAWPVVLVMVALIALFNALYFYQTWSSRGLSTATLQPLVTFSAVLIFGPTALWLDVLATIGSFWFGWYQARAPLQRWLVIRNRLFDLVFTPLCLLISLRLYEQLGGDYPLAGLAWTAVVPALLAVAVNTGLQQLVLIGYFLSQMWLFDAQIFRRFNLSRVLLFFLAAMLPPSLFAILAAGLYTQVGLPAFLPLMGAAVLTSLLAHRLSRAVQRSETRARELDQLAQLSRALLGATPDVASLVSTLAAYVPQMFHFQQIAIQLLDGSVLLQIPDDASTGTHEPWRWVSEHQTPQTFAAGAVPPYGGPALVYDAALVPILAMDSGLPIGGISITVDRHHPAVGEMLPALQELAAQIASALHRMEEYTRELAYQRVSQELQLAGEIQASFLPATLPTITGWQLAAALRPARETSGDFYDLFELPDNRLGMLIADVADKGTGAALFMALSRTLLRTYAFEYPTRPEAVLQAANRRMLIDAPGSMFVTVFYGVLDPTRSVLSYANAGHNPPLLMLPDDPPSVHTLGNTGVPLGIEREMTWSAREVVMPAGGRLLLYTDGVTEAQNTQQVLFAEWRLREVVVATREHTAQAMLAAVLDAVAIFTEGAPQSDDITIVALVHETNAGAMG